MLSSVKTETKLNESNLYLGFSKNRDCRLARDRRFHLVLEIWSKIKFPLIHYAKKYDSLRPLLDGLNGVSSFFKYSHPTGFDQHHFLVRVLMENRWIPPAPLGSSLVHGFKLWCFQLRIHSRTTDYASYASLINETGKGIRISRHYTEDGWIERRVNLSFFIYPSDLLVKFNSADKQVIGHDWQIGIAKNYLSKETGNFLCPKLPSVQITRHFIKSILTNKSDG